MLQHMPQLAMAGTEQQEALAAAEVWDVRRAHIHTVPAPAQMHEHECKKLRSNLSS
jgi:hypothetical protein